VIAMEVFPVRTSEYPYLPAECRGGRCGHDPERCLRYRSRRCLSGECAHARQGLLCAVNYPGATGTVQGGSPSDKPGIPS
jgi:hypothetical protein